MPTSPPPAPRLQPLRLAKSGLVLAGGALYALLVSWLGWGIPCPFYTLTSCECPACGVTRMLLSLLSGDVSRAYQLNAGLLLIAPLLILILGYHWLRWLRGDRRLENSVIHFLGIFAVLWLLGWGVLRNFI